MDPARRLIENYKKIAKKFKKLKNTITASFQAKIGWKILRKKENEYYHDVCDMNFTNNCDETR